MRASPPFQASLHRFGMWRGAMLVLALLGVSATVAWLATREEPPEYPLLVAAGLGCSLVVFIAVSLSKVPPICLRWDGQTWHLGQPGTDVEAWASGNMSVKLDLGPWMLLRFRPATQAPFRLPSRVKWIPAQRLGAEGHWHGLRCAVYSPRPAPAGAAGSTTAPLDSASEH